MLAPQAEGFEESLAHRGDIDPELAHAVVHHRRAGRGLFRCPVLDDLKPADTGTLDAPAAYEEAAVTGRPQKDSAGGRKIGLGVEVFRDADSVPEDGCLDVIPGIRVYAAHQVDKFARLRLVVAAKLVYRFSDQVDWHLLTLACFRYGKDSICQPAIGAEI